VTWVNITSGGGELVCVTTTDPRLGADNVLLHRLPRSNQVLSFSASAVLHMHIGGEAEWFALDDPLTDDQVAGLLRGVAVPPPGVPRPVRDDDAPLLAALARDGRAGVVELAHATGWPQSRVSSRLHELLATGSARIEVDLAAEQLGFRAAAYLWLTVAPGALHETGHALSLHPETSFAAAVTGASNLLTVVTCRDAAALYTFVTTKVGALAPVRQVDVVPVLRRLKQAGTRVRNGRLVLA
jgi:DNA-binding Lrp family transcriptional regulator